MTASVTDQAAEHTGSPRCQCVHAMPWADEPCSEAAELEISLGERTVLLCAECLDAWCESDPDRYGVARLTAREL